MSDRDNCVTIELDWQEKDNYVFANLIDKWIDENLSECSVCTYYEERGTVGERLEMAIQNEVILNAIILFIEMEKSNETA